MQQLEEDVLDVLADVTSFGECGRIGDRERNVEHARERLGHVRLAAPSRTEEQDVALLEFDLVPALRTRRLVLDAPVVVEHRDSEHLLGLVLTDDVLIEERTDVARDGKLGDSGIDVLDEFLVYDLVAEVDALVADVDARTSDEFLDLLLRLPAERTLHQFGGVTKLCHESVDPQRIGPVRSARERSVMISSITP